MQDIFQVLEVDDTRNRFLLSLKPSDLKLGHRLSEEEVGQSLEARLHSYLEERDAVIEQLAASGGGWVHGDAAHTCSSVSREA